MIELCHLRVNSDGAVSWVMFSEKLLPVGDRPKSESMSRCSPSHGICKSHEFRQRLAVHRSARKARMDNRNLVRLPHRQDIRLNHSPNTTCFQTKQKRDHYLSGFRGKRLYKDLLASFLSYVTSFFFPFD